MDVELLKNILSIPSYFGKEVLVKNFLLNYANENDIIVKTDVKGNIYLVKGVLDEGESYPCVVAHMDTVHSDQEELIAAGGKLDIHKGTTDGSEYLYATKKDGDKNILTGIGGDDKAGIFACLEIMKGFDKIMGAFFVEEEYGCKGSKNADGVILKDVGYFIQFDAPTDDWCSFTCAGHQLFNKVVFDKIRPVLNSYAITNYSNDPYTDVMMLKRKFPVACMNFFAGYERMHSKDEFVVIASVYKAVNLGIDMIKVLGTQKYEFELTFNVDNELYIETQQLGKNISNGIFD